MANKIILRDYQAKAKDALRDGFRRGGRRGLLIGATGFGKTETVASIIEDAVKIGSRVIFLADRTALVRQTSQRLAKSKIRHGVLQGENTFGRREQVLVCSQQTLEKRGFINDADLVILDEAHTQRKKMLAMLKPMTGEGKAWGIKGKSRIIGLTATPFSAGMGSFYDFTVTGASTKQLQDEGWLVPLKVYLGTEIDKSKLKYSSGEFTSQSVAEAGQAIIGDIVTEWVAGVNREFGGPVKTLCFVPTVAYGADITGQFARAGYNFQQVSYRQTPEENQQAIENLRAGNVDGLVSVEALVKGLDIPDVQCLVVARKYAHSLISHIQMLGRGMRSCLDIEKEYCLVNDHTGNCPRFEAEAEPFWQTGEWELSSNEKKRPAPKEREETEEETKKERECRSCGFFLPPGARTCPACGFAMPAKKPVNIAVKAGKMRLYKSDKSRFDSMNIWNIISTIALRRKGANVIQAEKFARIQYKNIRGRWPAWDRPLDYSGEYDAEIDLIIDAQIKSYVRRKKRNAKKRHHA